jgi:hypothetical protein
MRLAGVGNQNEIDGYRDGRASWGQTARVLEGAMVESDVQLAMIGGAGRSRSNRKVFSR